MSIHHTASEAARLNQNHLISELQQSGIAKGNQFVNGILGAKGGLFVVVGPAGSGKAASMCAIAKDLLHIHRDTTMVIQKNQVGLESLTSLTDRLERALEIMPKFLVIKPSIETGDDMTLVIRAVEAGINVVATMRCAYKHQLLDVIPCTMTTQDRLEECLKGVLWQQAINVVTPRPAGLYGGPVVLSSWLLTSLVGTPLQLGSGTDAAGAMLEEGLAYVACGAIAASELVDAFGPPAERATRLLARLSQVESEMTHA